CSDMSSSELEAQIADLERARFGGADFPEQRSQMLQPCRLKRRIRLRRSVAEHIDVEGTVGQRPGLFDHLPGLGHRGWPYTERTQTAGIGYHRSQCRG